MSDNIPFEIQMEIMKWFPVKHLIQFRSVSKQWKSAIDSSDFIKAYGARHTQPHSHLLTYRSDYVDNETKFIFLVDDDIETFKLVQQQDFVVSPLLKQYPISRVVGECHGLLCFKGFNNDNGKKILVISNPSIRKSFGISVVSKRYTFFGFGVCPVTKDPTVVKIVYAVNKPWHVEVFTVSLGVWSVIPSANLPRQSITLATNQVVIGRFIYWGASENVYTHDGDEYIINYMVMSFDLITKEFKVIHLPDSFTNELHYHVSVSKLRESLVVSGCIMVEGVECCDVWVMEHDSSFRKLFTVRACVRNILGFSKTGETMIEIREEGVGLTTPGFYDPCSQHIKNLGISGMEGLFFMDSPKESLLLLDHSDLHIYSDES